MQVKMEEKEFCIIITIALIISSLLHSLIYGSDCAIWLRFAKTTHICHIHLIFKVNVANNFLTLCYTAAISP